MNDYINIGIIGVGARGNAYGAALKQCVSNLPLRIAAVAEPNLIKRAAFIEGHVHSRFPCRAFDTWQEFVDDEKDLQSFPKCHFDAVDGVFICTLDETHAEIITALAPLNLHIMSEKPLATTLAQCLSIYQCLRPPDLRSPLTLFSVGHVLRYSPHNILLHKLVTKDEVIGDILSLEHTEPVGWWHFSHSYVR